MTLRARNIKPLQGGGAGISTTRKEPSVAKRLTLISGHPMNHKCKRPPLAHASGTPVMDNFNIPTAQQRLAIFSQDQSAGGVQ
jgi:hypothetical protein